MSLAWQVALTVLAFWVGLSLAALVLWIAVVRLVRACEQLWEGEP